MPEEVEQTAGAAEHEPRNAQLSSHVGGPILHRVRDDAARRRVLLPEDRRQRPAERAASIQEGHGVLSGRHAVEVLAARGQPEFLAWEAKGDEPDGDAGPPRALDVGLDPRGVGGGGDEGDVNAAAGEEMGHVDHRNGVALRHEGNQHEVSCGVHGCSFTPFGTQLQSRW